MPRGLDQLGFQAERFKLLQHPLAGLAHIGFVLAVGTNAGNAQQFAQIVFEMLGVDSQVIVDCGHDVTVSHVAHEGMLSQ